ncbi:MAG: ABC transporter permease subunit [Thermoanaerobaculia bacterium]|jgi:ABC-type transport system involved in multi-copper enzyme maturation permease subunit
MFREILRFEIAHHLNHRLFYCTATVLFLFALGLMSSDLGVVFSHSPARVARNAPYVIVKLQAGLSSLGLFVIPAFVASSILRDFKHGTHPLFFSKPIRKFDYLLGRFSGSLLISLALFVITALGLLVGSIAPWQEAARVGPFLIAPYAVGLVLLVVPNLLVMGAIFFTVTSLSRSMLFTYVCVVVFICLQDYAEILAKELDSGFLGSLIEPLGISALETASRYWTVTEYDTVLPGLSWPLLSNRLVWLALGGVTFIVGYSVFSYSRATARSWWSRRRRQAAS